ncbi:MAG: hypothetical protein DRI86_00790 [Bacteroidetes bacterium]|nr:MAG: hypothetical protein DRI86_00790 [Bacteroidota bacterium]
MLNIKEVNTPSWNSEINNNTSLVLFLAPWCESCKVQNSILKNISTAAVNNINILNMNIDDNRWLSQKLGVRNIPTIIIYKKGVEEFRFSELVSKDLLEKELYKYNNEQND